MSENKPYYPPKPNNPYLSGDCDSGPHDHPDQDCGCGQMPGPAYPPPPPKPGLPPEPGCYPWMPPPGLEPVPPVPTVLEGQSLYQAVDTLARRVNTCIGQWNAISRNCFAAMNACVEAARANDVYYDDDEVKYITGYSEADGCPYSLIQKEPVDRNGQPIFVRLAPAYDNSSNSGVTQDIFDVSFIKSANVIMTAVPPQNEQWYFPAMWQGAPIPGEYPPGYPDPTYYVAGFTRGGALRYFANTVSETELCQNGMVDVIGPVIPLLSDGEVTDQGKQLTQYASITAMGYAKGTGRVYFFSCSAVDAPGLSGITVARILQGYGCTTAVATSVIPAANQNISAGMLYMGQMTSVPQGGKSPDNLAYWYISKKPCFRNKFQKEVADLVQTTGQNSWKNFLLGQQIQSFDDRITQTAKDLEAEIQRAKDAEAALQTAVDEEQSRAEAAEKTLQDNIDAEQSRAEAAERQLQANIDAEKARAEAAETALDQKIQAETTRAEDAENDLAQRITQETSRATQAEAQLNAAINAEKLRAQNRENEIQSALDKEIQERIAADNDIINAIEQETLARRAADTALQNNIDAVNNSLTTKINTINNSLADISAGTTKLPYLPITGGVLSGPVSFSSNDTVTLGRGPTADLEAATKKYVDDAVAAGGGGGTGGDVSKEYVDQQVTNLQTQLEGKVSKSGDTMTGNLNMAGNLVLDPTLTSTTGVKVQDAAGGPTKVVNVAAPTDPTDAATKQYVDDAVADAGSEVDFDQFVMKEGSNMTGTLGIVNTQMLKFIDPTQTAVTLDENGEDTVPYSGLAQRLGITKELQGKSRSGIQTFAVDSKGGAGSSNWGDGSETGGGSGTGGAGSTDWDTDTDVSGGEDEDTEETPGGDEEEAGPDLPGVDSSDVQGPTVGSVYMDGQDIALNSTDGGVILVGDEVKIMDHAGAGVPLTMGNTTLKTHRNSGQTADHLDINVGSSTGSVYINRTTSGTVQTGGTGELNVTTIKAPNELDLVPGTAVDLNGKPLKGVNLVRTTATSTKLVVAAGPTSSNPDGTVSISKAEIYDDAGEISATISATNSPKYMRITPANGTLLNIGAYDNSGVGINNNQLKFVANGTSGNDGVNLSQLKSYSGTTFATYSLTTAYLSLSFTDNASNSISIQSPSTTMTVYISRGASEIAIGSSSSNTNRINIKNNSTSMRLLILHSSAGDSTCSMTFCSPSQTVNIYPNALIKRLQ